MSVDEYYKSMGVKHEADCLICKLESRERKAHRGFLRRVWELEHTPNVLAVLLLLGGLYVASKAIYIIVGGL